MHNNSLCETTDCTGCSACKNICGRDAISMKPDNHGFLHPIVDHSKCIACGACSKVCPILNVQDIRIPINQTARKGWATDEETLANSSSGGVFSLLAEYILGNNGHVYGASLNSLNWKLHHISVDNVEALQQLRGSKYLQSDLEDTYKEVRSDLLKGIPVLYVGTPCQIAGLHFFLKHKDYSNLLTVDLVCHGVPSPDVFKSYIEYLNKQNRSEVVKYFFREKKWCWTRYNSLAVFENGSMRRGKWEEDPYMRGFLRELFLRESCYKCLFSNENRQGDVTLADYWAYKCKPSEIDNKERGCSLILMNNDKGREIVTKIQSSMISYPITIEEAYMGNQALHKCFSKNPLSNYFWECFKRKGFGGVIDEFLYPERKALRYKLIYTYGLNSLVFRSYLFAKKLKQLIWK